uniref:Mediator of RNA polymerase II transcription subunit 28 n=1 Tax=Romanomermis culicivorax TaxID=13658 RepID=A0A915J034_ROMCU
MNVEMNELPPPAPDANNDQSSAMDDGDDEEGSAKDVKKLLDEFRESFVACLNSLQPVETVRAIDAEEVKLDADVTIQRLIESAQNLEIDLNKKYLLFSTLNPEETVNQQITEIKTEIERKDALLAKFNKKLTDWSAVLAPPMSVNAPTKFSALPSKK